jgi:hypothetical protein
MGFELSPSWKSGLSQAIAAAHRLNWGRAGVAGGLGLGIQVFQKRPVWYDFEKDKNTYGLR